MKIHRVVNREESFLGDQTTDCIRIDNFNWREEDKIGLSGRVQEYSFRYAHGDTVISHQNKVIAIVSNAYLLPGMDLMFCCRSGLGQKSRCENETNVGNEKNLKAKLSFKMV